MKTVGIIPARYGSTRFPGKPLADLGGKPVIQHVVERCQIALPNVIVATDDQRIINAVKKFGGNAMMTRRDHKSGSDRIAEIAAQIDAEIIVNIQGDEPFIAPEMILSAISPLETHTEIKIVTLIREIKNPKDFSNPNIVKVVVNQQQEALYFSRSQIPYTRYAGHGPIYEHIGLYAYRKTFLLKYIQWPPTPLEKAESLEQLRILENGYPIQTIETNLGYGAPCIDTPEDLERARNYLKFNSSINDL